MFSNKELRTGMATTTSENPDVGVGRPVGVAAAHRPLLFSGLITFSLPALWLRPFSVLDKRFILGLNLLGSFSSREGTIVTATLLFFVF